MLIYPTAGNGSNSGNGMNASAGGQKGGRAAARGAVQRKAEATKTKSKQQTVLWKHADVEQGVVVVDEKQLMRLVKTEPIENHYRLDTEPFAKSVCLLRYFLRTVYAPAAVVETCLFFLFFTFLVCLRRFTYIIYIYIFVQRGPSTQKIYYRYGNVVLSLTKK